MRLANLARVAKQTLKRTADISLLTVVAFSSLAMAAPLFLTQSAYATGAPITVCSSGCDWTSISSAVAAANDGDTISLSAGTYDEGSNSIAINKSLSFVGPNSSVSPVSNLGSRTAEAIIEGDAGYGSATFYVASSSSTVSFSGIKFQNLGEPVRSDAPGATISFQKDIFTSNSADTNDYMGFDDSNLTINDSLFTNLNMPNTDVIQMWVSSGSRGGAISITNNKWQNISSGVASGALNLSDIAGTISGNTFDNVGDYAITVANNASLAISNNTFNDISNDSSYTDSKYALGAGVRIYQDSPSTAMSANVTGNTFSNSHLGIGVRHDADISSDNGNSMVVSHNTFKNNSMSVYSDPTVTGALSLSGNWWNNALGPNSSDYSGDITIANWCTSSSCASTTSGSSGTISLPTGPIATPTVSGHTSSVTVPSTNDLTASVSSNSGNVKIIIPKGATVTADSATWDGIIKAPTIKSNSSVTIPTVAGTINTVATVIDVGAGNTNLTFSKAVKLVIPNQAGKLVGFIRDSKFTQITKICSANTQAAGNALPAGGDCYINVGNDMVVWTKHFTTFVAYSTSNKYVVKSGDTMSGIAAHYSLSLAKLEQLNPSAGHPAGNFSLIQPGDILKLGGAVESAVATSSTNTTVNATAAKVLGSKTKTPNHAGVIGTAASTTTPSATVAAAKGLKWYEWLAISAAVVCAIGSVGYIYRSVGRR